MKVLMFGWEFPPFISGGLGTACYGLAKGLSELEVKIDFVLPNASDEEPANNPVEIISANSVKISENIYKSVEFLDLIKFIKLDTLLRPYDTEKSYNDSYEINHTQQSSFSTSPVQLPFQGGYGKNLMEEIYRLQAVAYQLGKETDAEIIHAHDWMTFPAAIAAKKASGLPLVVHVHATEYDRSGQIIYSQTYDIEKQGMEASDLVVAVSNRTKALLVQYYHIPAEKIHVVHNAVDKSDPDNYAKLEKQFKEPLVLFLGRITAQKGPGYFLETARLVLEKRKNVRFVMAGSGDLLSDMVHLCAQMKIQDRFHFTGFLQGNDLHNIFQLSDVLVMPSISEPFGIVPIEALKYKLPVIISKQSGVAEILPHALVIDFWDTKLFAQTIIDIIDNPQKKAKHIKDNLKTLEDINWTNSAAELIKIYKKLV